MYSQYVAEVSAGHDHYRYQQHFSMRYSKTAWGFLHTASLVEFYAADTNTEIMTQLCVTLRAGFFRIGIGMYYASKPGFTPSANIQLLKKS